MLRSHKAFILIAVMFWQALSWLSPVVVTEQAQRLAHVMVHDEVVDHHHHHDESIHLQDSYGDAVHVHADGGIQPLGMTANIAAMSSMGLPTSLPQAAVFSPPTVCLDGLLRPPQANV